MRRADNEPSVVFEPLDLGAHVDELRRMCGQGAKVRDSLDRLSDRALSWNGTPAGLSDLASQLRQALDYRAVSFGLLEGEALCCYAVDPPDTQIAANLTGKDLACILEINQPYLFPHTQDVLIVPLAAGGQRVGVVEIVVDSKLLPSEIDLWQALGPRLASMIAYGQSRLAVEQARQREQFLRDLGGCLTSGAGLETMLADVLALAISWIGADSGSLMLLDGQDQIVHHILPGESISRADTRAIDHGLAEWMIGNRQPLIIADLAADERWAQIREGAEPVRSVLSVPLQHRERIQGLIVFVHREPAFFGQDRLPILLSAAGQIAMAVENALLVEQTHRQMKELALITEISQAASSLHLSDVLHTVVRGTVEALQAQRCAVYLLDEHKRHVVLRATGDPDLIDSDLNLVVSLTDRPHVAGAIQTRQPTEIGDVYADERLRRFWDKAHQLDIQSQLAVPLIARERVIGAISVDRGAPNSPLNEGERDLLQAIARQAANAVENALLYEEVQSRADRLWLANRIGHDIGTQLDIHQLLWEVVRMIRETFDCYYVAVGLIEADELVFRAGISYLHQTIPQIRLPLHDEPLSIAGWVARRGRSCLVQDVREDPRYRARFGLEDIRSQLCVPLKVLDRTLGKIGTIDHTIGVLDVASTEVRAFSEEDQQLLEALAAQVSVAIENARLFSRVQEERATLEAIITGTDDAIVITDLADHVLFVNPAAQKAFCGGEPLRPGSTLSEVVDNKALWALWQRASQGDTQPTEIPLPDGCTLYGSVTAVVDVGKVAVMQDITHLKKLDEMKSEFVSTVSHDLRSPLQVIQSSAELIPRLGETNQEQQRQVEHIIAVVRRISDLVQNLLDIGRIEAGVGMDVEPCAMDEIIARAAGSCRPLADSKGLEFEIDVPRTLALVKGNPLRLDQVITNLLSNAIKFTPEGTITLTAWEDGDSVVLEVRDTGLGIPLDAQEKLFQKFYRVKSPETRGIPGTGLGLAIVKSIVEGYGGQIELVSLPHLGSTFRISLPVYEDISPIGG